MIKALCENDIGLLADMRDKYFSDGWTASMLESAFKTDGFYAYGFFEGDVLTGFITYSTCDDSADLQDVLVVPEHRGKGQAKELLGYMIQDLLLKGVKKVFLEVRTSNAVAITFYESFGFKVISTRKKYYSDCEDALVMLKEN